MKVLLAITSIMLSSGFWHDIKHFGIAMIGYGAYSAMHDGHVFSGLVIGVVGTFLWLYALGALLVIEDDDRKDEK